MKRLRALLLSFFFAGAACGPAASSPGTTSAEATPTSRALHALFDEAWEHELEEWPTRASSLGDNRYDDKWPDVSLAAYARRDAYDRELLARLGHIDRAKLSPKDALSWDLFEYRLRRDVEGQRFKLHLLPIDQRNGIQSQDDLADDLTFKTVKDYEAWNTRLATFGAYMDQTIALLQEGIRVGYTHPRVVMTRITAQIAAQIVDDPKKSGYWAPYKKIPPSMPERARLEAAAEKAIRTSVVPAFQRLEKFWAEQYLPACKPNVGVWQLPDGKELYAYTARQHTTTKLTPDQIHAVGLREVARIRGAMEEVKAKTGFSGSLKEFFAFLRTDKRFFYATPEELLAGYRDVSKRVDPQLVKVFRKLPRTPYGVQAIPATTAPDTTTAYYREPAADGSRAGTYFVNLYKPEARPKWEMMSLTLHESVPGHHLQIALAMEEEGLPQFRRHAEWTAYVEGWALYAESLGDEMGLYDDPYAKFGQLTYEMWRAVRLVVDTGIHHLEWDRQRAIDFFMENAAKSELDVINEVDRYIVWPGQALAYKIGELEIKKLRKERQAALGAKFDLKAFHDVVLRSGALPLEVLAREVQSQR